MPVRWTVTATAPILTLIAFATYRAWDTDLHADQAAGISLAMTVAALLASPWAILAAPTRWSRLVAVGSLLLAALTAVLWFVALRRLLSTT